jgi:iron complex outermembrane recepter protein
MTIKTHKLHGPISRVNRACLMATTTWVALCACSSSAFAQTEIAETVAQSADIVVTVAKREQKIEDVAAAVTVITGRELEADGILEITDLAAKIPSLAFTKDRPGESSLSIRGLVDLTGGVSGFPTVGIYVDGVPLLDDLALDVGLFDLERIEVLRGPQGTLYGEGASAGIIHLISAIPKLSAFEGTINGELSTTRSGGANYKLSSTLNTPLVPNLAGLRLSAFYQKDGGFIDNVALGFEEKDADASNRYGARATLLIKPNDDFTFTLSGTHQTIEGGALSVVLRDRVPGQSPPLATQFGSEIGYRQFDEVLNDRVSLGSAVLNYELGFATLTSASSYSDRIVTSQRDSSSISNIISTNLAPLAASFGIDPFFIVNGTQIRSRNRNQTFAQEVRLVSSGDASLNWTIGGYFRKRKTLDVNDVRVPDSIAIFSSFNPTSQGEFQNNSANVKHEQVALFGEATYALTPAFNLTAGLRWFQETVTGAQSIGTINTSTSENGFPLPSFGSIDGISFPTLKTRERKVVWKLGTSYRVSDDLLLYSSAAEGFRPGGVNPGFDPDPSVNSPPVYKSDQVITYEIGAKTEWLNRALKLNIAVYQSDLSDAQINAATNIASAVVQNAGAARIRGIELEIVARPSRRFELGVTGSILSAEFTRSVLGDGGTPEAFLITKGDRLPVTRDSSVSAYLTYRAALSNGLTLVSHADIAYVSDAVPNLGDVNQIAGYTDANLRFGIEADRWSITAFADNLFDQVGEFGFAQSSAFGLARNKPRTIGVRAGLQF